LAREGYDTTQIQKVPQRWEPAEAAARPALQESYAEQLMNALEVTYGT
jgi:hypothetical protein